MLLGLRFSNIVNVRAKRTRVAGILLSLAVLALLTSTTVYMVVTFMYNEAFYLDDMIGSAADLWEFHPRPDFNSARSAWDLEQDYTSLYQRTGTAAVMINVCVPPVSVWTYLR